MLKYTRKKSTMVEFSGVWEIMLKKSICLPLALFPTDCGLGLERKLYLTNMFLPLSTFWQVDTWDTKCCSFQSGSKLQGRTSYPLPLGILRPACLTFFASYSCSLENVHARFIAHRRRYAKRKKMGLYIHLSTTVPYPGIFARRRLPSSGISSMAHQKNATLFEPWAELLLALLSTSTRFFLLSIHTPPFSYLLINRSWWLHLLSLFDILWRLSPIFSRDLWRAVASQNTLSSYY